MMSFFRPCTFDAPKGPFEKWSINMDLQKTHFSCANFGQMERTVTRRSDFATFPKDVRKGYSLFLGVYPLSEFVNPRAMSSNPHFHGHGIFACSQNV